MKVLDFELFIVLISNSYSQEILHTNAELAEEVDKLYKTEDRILIEKDQMSDDMTSLRETIQKLQDNLNLSANLEESEAVRRENDQLRLENELLTSSQKSTADKLHVVEKKMENLRKELMKERQKCADVTTWRDQLVEKNKRLVEENERLGSDLTDELFLTIIVYRLTSRAEHLEGLVNQEIGDIGDILQTIKIIQERKVL